MQIFEGKLEERVSWYQRVAYRVQLRANPISFRVTSAGSCMKRQYFPAAAETKEEGKRYGLENCDGGRQDYRWDPATGGSDKGESAYNENIMF